MKITICLHKYIVPANTKYITTATTHIITYVINWKYQNKAWLSSQLCWSSFQVSFGWTNVACPCTHQLDLLYHPMIVLCSTYIVVIDNQHCFGKKKVYLSFAMKRIPLYKPLYSPSHLCWNSRLSASSFLFLDIRG